MNCIALCSVDFWCWKLDLLNLPCCVPWGNLYIIKCKVKSKNHDRIVIYVDFSFMYKAFLHFRLVSRCREQNVFHCFIKIRETEHSILDFECVPYLIGEDGRKSSFASILSSYFVTLLNFKCFFCLCKLNCVISLFSRSLQSVSNISLIYFWTNDLQHIASVSAELCWMTSDVYCLYLLEVWLHMLVFIWAASKNTALVF